MCVLIFSTNFSEIFLILERSERDFSEIFLILGRSERDFSEIFLILGRTERDIITNVCSPSLKCQLFLSDFN
jgi:hypothetical protein